MDTHPFIELTGQDRGRHGSGSAGDDWWAASADQELSAARLISSSLPASSVFLSHCRPSMLPGLPPVIETRSGRPPWRKPRRPALLLLRPLHSCRYLRAVSTPSRQGRGQNNMQRRPPASARHKQCPGHTGLLAASSLPSVVEFQLSASDCLDPRVAPAHLPSTAAPTAPWL
jgi:hypothetical protein